MTVKLVGSSSGSVALDAPASTTGGANIEFKLPVADGSANQLLKTDGSGNLGWATDQGGTFASYAIIGDQKSSTTAGGTFTTGAWRTRDLNTEITDPDGIVSLSSNQFTLAAGTYLVNASAPAHRVNNHQVRLRNNDDGINYFGTSEWSHNSYATTTRSFVSARFTIAASKAFELQHRCMTTYSTIGFGRTSDFGAIELYTLVEIYKES